MTRKVAALSSLATARRTKISLKIRQKQKIRRPRMSLRPLTRSKNKRRLLRRKRAQTPNQKQRKRKLRSQKRRNSTTGRTLLTMWLRPLPRRPNKKTCLLQWLKMKSSRLRKRKKKQLTQTSQRRRLSLVKRVLLLPKKDNLSRLLTRHWATMTRLRPGERASSPFLKRERSGLSHKRRLRDSAAQSSASWVTSILEKL